MSNQIVWLARVFNQGYEYVRIFSSEETANQYIKENDIKMFYISQFELDRDLKKSI